MPIRPRGSTRSPRPCTPRSNGEGRWSCSTRPGSFSPPCSASSWRWSRCVLLPANTGWSPGKRLLGLSVVDPTADPADSGSHLARSILGVDRCDPVRRPGTPRLAAGEERRLPSPARRSGRQDSRDRRQGGCPVHRSRDVRPTTNSAAVWSNPTPTATPWCRSKTASPFAATLEPGRRSGRRRPRTRIYGPSMLSSRTSAPHRRSRPSPWHRDRPAFTPVRAVVPGAARSSRSSDLGSPEAEAAHPAAKVPRPSHRLPALDSASPVTPHPDFESASRPSRRRPLTRRPNGAAMNRPLVDAGPTTGDESPVGRERPVPQQFDDDWERPVPEPAPVWTSGRPGPQAIAGREPVRDFFDSPPLGSSSATGDTVGLSPPIRRWPPPTPNPCASESPTAPCGTTSGRPGCSGTRPVSGGYATHRDRPLDPDRLTCPSDDWEARRATAGPWDSRRRPVALAVVELLVEQRRRAQPSLEVLFHDA